MSRIRANQITNQSADGAPTVQNGLVISGVTTSTSFSGSFSGSGASLTNLNASNIASGTVPTARLGSGTANSSTFLRGDSTFATVTSTTINNNANNRVITGSGTANTLEAESSVVIDDNGKLGVGEASPASRLNVNNASHYVVTNRGKSDHLHINGAYGNSGEFGGSISFTTTSTSAAAIACRQYSNTAHQLGLSFFTHPTTTQTDDAEEKLRLHADGRLQPMYSSSAGATGGIMMVGAFNARPSAHHGEGIVQAKTNTDVNCFDSAGWYNNSTYRYTPQVKGHYIFHGTGMMYTGMNGSSCEQSVYFVKNNSAGSGSVPQYASGYSTNFGNYDLQHISNVIYMNGTTDYVHFHLSSNQSTQIHNGSSWMGWLLYPAA